jgi:hypothetical protein
MRNNRLLASILYALNRESDYEKHVYEWQSIMTHRLIAVEQRIDALNAKLEALLARLGVELAISFNDLED